jgi:hypothetical protein
MLDDELLVVLGLLEDSPDRAWPTLLWDVKNEDFEWTTLADVEGERVLRGQAKPS